MPRGKPSSDTPWHCLFDAYIEAERASGSAPARAKKVSAASWSKGRERVPGIRIQDKPPAKTRIHMTQQDPPMPEKSLTYCLDPPCWNSMVWTVQNTKVAA